MLSIVKYNLYYIICGGILSLCGPVTCASKILFEGKFGLVLEAFSDSGAALVVKKIIHGGSQMYKEEHIATFLSLGQGERSHVVTCFGFWTPNQRPEGLIFAREKLDLGCYIKKEGALSLNKVRQFARQLLEGLDFFTEKGIVHADIKPENILLSENEEVVKFTDFGLSFFAEERDRFFPVQTIYYRSPEVILRKSYSYPIDVWGVAVIIAELAIGRGIFWQTSECDMFAVQLHYAKREFSPEDVESFLPPVRVLFQKAYTKWAPVKPLEVTVREKSRAGDEEEAGIFLDLIQRGLRINQEERGIPVNLLTHPFFSIIEGPACKKQKIEKEDPVL